MTADRMDQDSRLDWVKCDTCARKSSEDLAQNLKNKLVNALTGRLSRSNSESSVTSDAQQDLKSDDWSNLDKGINNNSGELSMYRERSVIFDPDCIDRTVCDELAFLLHSCLVKAQDQELHRRVMLPQDLIQKLSRDIVHLSRSEPYGLRGCVLFINLESDAHGLERLGRIECNSHVVSTFEVHVTLKEDVKRWCTLKDLVFRGLFSCKDEEVYLSVNYTLVKKKLYRRNSAKTCSQCC